MGTSRVAFGNEYTGGWALDQLVGWYNENTGKLEHEALYSQSEHWRIPCPQASVGSPSSGFWPWPGW
jgi:hypothetical protein